MKTVFYAIGWVGLTCGWLATAQTSTPSATWHYTLLGPSFLLDECPMCGRPAIPEPLRGTFDLRLVSSNDEGRVYAVENLVLSTTGPWPAGRRLTGGGEYRVLTPNQQSPKQELILNLNLTMPDVVTNRALQFTNDSPVIARPFPLLNVTLTDTNGSMVQVFHLEIVAAPVRDLWFSTSHNFTGMDGRNGRRGDLLSSEGRFVKREGDLLKNLGLMPGSGGYNVDALEVAAKGEVLFSFDEDVHSEAQGKLSHGDLLSSLGEVAISNAELLQPFMPMPPIQNAGLDAIHRLSDGTLLFSIKSSLFSQSLGRLLGPGDLLTEQGEVYRTPSQLLTAFHTSEPGDAGLDAVYVWPHGEIWFSVENGFQDNVLGPIQPGDLLSSYGYVVFKNLELMAPFQPLEDLADFGLDALYVVTDMDPPPATPPQITAIQLDPKTRTITFNWDGPGRVFGLEWADNLAGPWTPIPDLQADTGTRLEAPTNAVPARFYRLRQW